MTRKVFTGALGGALLAAGAILAGALPAAADPVTIRASSWHPPKHPGVANGYEPFMAYVKEKSNGTMDFKFWSGGSLLGAKDTLPGVENGIADIGVLALTYFPAEFPYAQLVSDLSMLSDNPPAVAAAVTELVVLHCKPCRKEFTDKGLVFTSSYSTTPYTLIGKQAYTSPAELKGKKFRSGGGLWDRWVASVGGTAITVPAAEMFEALDRGGVDVAVFSPAALQAFSLWDVAKYNTMLPLGTYSAMSLFTLNQRFWEGLSDAQRKILLDGAAVGAIGVTLGYEEQDKQALKKAEEHGVTFVKPSAELLAQRQEFIDADIKSVAANAKGKYGITDAAEVIATYRTLLKKWEGLMAEAGGDPQKMIAAMQTEIYAKVDLKTYGE